MEDSLAALSLTPSTRNKSASNSKPYLPSELLDQIWQATIQCTGPRIVDLRSESKMDGFTSSCRIPPLLHTCSRSRQLALQRWKLCFPSLDESGHEDAKVFFDYEQDTLFFTQEFADICHFADVVSREERMKIRSVAVDLKVAASVFGPTFGGVKFGQSAIYDFDAGIRLAFVLREGRENEQAWARGGKMISFFPAREPREGQVQTVTESEMKFLAQYDAARSSSRGREVPRTGFVGIRIVEEGSEAWDFEDKEGEAGEEKWWKVRWKIWFQQKRGTQQNE
ncbi:hypothetical protein N431DRAFT_225255 [Stipitochalara longipes BDJ]|nr:hypothetical protein N431DRAFT_225255 [Stipitochalara longipes BDJ]